MENEELQLRPFEKLPFNPKKQSAILGHLILNNSFFQKTHRKVKSNWFLSPGHSRIYTILLSVYEKIHRQPRIEELKNCEALEKEDLAMRNSIHNQIGICIADAGQLGLDLIGSEVIDWMRGKIEHESLLKTQKLFNLAKFNEVRQEWSVASKEFDEANLDEGLESRFDNLDFIDDIQKDNQNCLTTGLKLLDSAILSGATDGGLRRQDQTVVLAPIGVGKTSFLITVAVANIIRHKSVLFFTHEGNGRDIQSKVMRSFCGLTENELIDQYKDPEYIEQLSGAGKLIQQDFTHIHYIKSRMCVEDVIPIIKTLQEQRMCKTGKGYDLFCCDYPAKLNTNMSAKGNMNKRDIVDHVYNSFVELAGEMNWHSLVAYQTNREGIRINRGTYGSNKLIGQENASEAIGAMVTAANIITLNRSEEAKRDNYITMSIDKSRSSATGMAVVAKTEYEKCLLFSDKSKSFAYFGGHTVDSDVNGLLENMNGQIVTSEHFTNKGNK